MLLGFVYIIFLLWKQKYGVFSTLPNISIIKNVKTLTLNLQVHLQIKKINVIFAATNET